MDCPYCKKELGTTISNPMNCQWCEKQVYWSTRGPITKGQRAAVLLAHSWKEEEDERHP